MLLLITQQHIFSDAMKGVQFLVTFCGNHLLLYLPDAFIFVAIITAFFLSFFDITDWNGIIRTIINFINKERSK